MNTESGERSSYIDRLGRVQSLVRAFGVLDVLAMSEDGLTLTEVATAVQLPRSTVHRLLSTMADLGYVEFDPADCHWSVGVRAFTVGNVFARSRDLAKLGRPIMRLLMVDVGETVNISIERDHGIFYLGQIEASGVKPTLARPGARLPMHSTASGKALLACLPDRELDTFMKSAAGSGNGAHRFDPHRLMRELNRVRDRGYAIDDEENAEGMRCVAAPIFDEFGKPSAAISFSGSCLRLTDSRLPELGKMLVAAAQRMTTKIGGQMLAR